MELLKLAVGIVAFLLAAFSGAVFKIAPPAGIVRETDPQMLIALLSLATLCVLLVTWAIIRASRKRHRRIWAALTVVFALSFVIAGAKYYVDYGSKVFVYLDGQRTIASDSLTEFAKQMVAEDARKNNGIPLSRSQLLAKVGGRQNITALWTASSLGHNEQLLAAEYAIVVLCLAATVFAATEGTLGTLPRARKVTPS